MLIQERDAEHRGQPQPDCRKFRSDCRLDTSRIHQIHSNIILTATGLRKSSTAHNKTATRNRKASRGQKIRKNRDLAVEEKPAAERFSGEQELEQKARCSFSSLVRSSTAVKSAAPKRQHRKPWKPAQPAKLQPFKPAQPAKIVMQKPMAGGSQAL